MNVNTLNRALRRWARIVHGSPTAVTVWGPYLPEATIRALYILQHRRNVRLWPAYKRTICARRNQEAQAEDPLQGFLYEDHLQIEGTETFRHPR